MPTQLHATKPAKRLHAASSSENRTCREIASREANNKSPQQNKWRKRGTGRSSRVAGSETVPRTFSNLTTVSDGQEEWTVVRRRRRSRKQTQTVGQQSAPTPGRLVEVSQRTAQQQCQAEVQSEKSTLLSETFIKMPAMETETRQKESK